MQKDGGTIKLQTELTKTCCCEQGSKASPSAQGLHTSHSCQAAKDRHCREDSNRMNEVKKPQ